MANDRLKEMVGNLADGLVESVMIAMAEEGMKHKAGDLSKLDIVVATGEVESPISGKSYQLQISLVVNKNLWLGERTVGFRDTVGSFMADDVDENLN